MMTMLDNPAKRYLEIKDEIEQLEALKKEVAKSIELGDVVEHKGFTYEWVNYERTSTSWKGIYEEAYTMLDDEAQVIMGEMILRKTNKGLYQKFEKK
jgi:hypothetical protein